MERLFLAQNVRLLAGRERRESATYCTWSGRSEDQDPGRALEAPRLRPLLIPWISVARRPLKKGICSCRGEAAACLCLHGGGADGHQSSGERPG